MVFIGLSKAWLSQSKNELAITYRRFHSGHAFILLIKQIKTHNTKKETQVKGKKREKEQFHKMHEIKI